MALGVKAPSSLQIDSGGCLRVRVFGPLVLSWQGDSLVVPSRKGRALLALLALRGRPMARTAVAEMLWGPRGAKNLRQVLYALRQLPGAAQWFIDGELLGVRAQVLRIGEGELLEDLEARWFPESFRDWLEDQRSDAAFQREQLQQGALVEPLARLLAAARSVPQVEELAEALGVSDTLVFRSLPTAHSLVLKVQADASSHHRLASSLRDPVECAHHWLMAGQPDRAARALQRAGVLCDAAFTAVEPELQLELLGLALDEAERSADLESQEALLQRLSTLSQVGGFPAAACEAALRRALRACAAREMDLALDLAEEAHGIAVRHGLIHRGRVGLVLGQIWLIQGENHHALKAFDEAVQSEDEETSRVGLAGRGAARALLGQLHEALEDHQQALVKARAAGDAVRVARGLCNVASDLTRLGLFSRASRRYQDAAIAARELGDVALEMMALANAPLAALWAGEFGRCRVLVRDAQGFASRLEKIQEQGRVYDSRAELEWCCGRVEEAIQWFERAAAIHEDSGDSVRACLARANAAVGAAELDPQAVGAALERIEAFDAFERPLLSWRLRLELALFAPPEIGVACLAQRPPSGSEVLRALESLVRARWAVCAGDSVDDPEALLALSSTQSHLQPLAAALCAHLGLGNSLPAVLRARGEGLLADQQESMCLRLEGWIRTMTLR